MLQPIKKICIVGGGSAGYMSAVTLRRLLPGRQVTLVHSPRRPVIGVGESTTAYLPVFRQLALDRQRFYAEVQPSWKLGIRFIWGPPDVSHFNYAFGFEFSDRANHDPLRKRAAYYCLEHDGYAGPMGALMDHDLSPCLFVYGGRYHLIDSPFGYHIDNKKFLSYLENIGREFGVEYITGDVADVKTEESGDNDDDGVTFTSLWVAGAPASITVTASQAGRLDAWADFNNNGTFDAAEKIFNNQPLVAGPNLLSVLVPADTVSGFVGRYVRFRVSSAGGLAPTGSATDRKVEDYVQPFYRQPEVQNS